MFLLLKIVPQFKNMVMQTSLLYSDFFSFVYAPRSGVACSHGSSVFRRVKSLHPILHSALLIYICQQLIQFLFLPSLLQPLFIFVFG